MRTFPKTSQENLINFIYHSTRLDRIPIKIEDITRSLSRKKNDPDMNPHALGNFKAINLALILAQNDDLLKEPHTWLKSLNSAISTPIADHEILTLQTKPLPKSVCGTYRSVLSSLGGKPTCPPHLISKSLDNWIIPLQKLNASLAPQILNPRSLSSTNIKNITDAAYNANLQLCAIQPFQEGSNRTARIVENVIRQHFFLPWKIIPSDDDSKDDFAQNVRDMLDTMKF